MTQIMDGSMHGQGWQALTNISSFMQHIDKRKELKIFGQLDARLDYCQFLIRKQSNKNDIQRFKSKKRKKELNEDLVNALKSLAIDQLIAYYNKLIEQLLNLTHNICTPPTIEDKSFIFCEAYSRTYSLKMWKKKKLRFDRENHIIYAEKDKKIKIYDLSNYIIRKSDKGDYFALALEAINDIPLQRSKTAHFGFQYKSTYILWFNSILRSTQYKQWESLVVSLNKEQLISKNRTENMAKEKEWERLNKTEGHHHIAQQDEQPIEMVQSALYIPHHNENTEEINITQQPTMKNKESSLSKEENILTSSFKAEEELDFESLLKQSYAYRLTHLIDAFQSIEDLQFQLQMEDDILKKNKLQISFAHALLDELNINTSDLQNVTNYQKVQPNEVSTEAQHGFSSIFQHNNCPNHFKLIYRQPIRENLEVKTILQHFLDLLRYKQINKSISECSTKAVIYSENSTINYEQHHPYNRLYRPRQFFYIRHLTRNIHKEYLIIDRSITHSLPLPTNSFFIRGQLQTIYKFSTDQHHLKVVADIKMSHGGELTQAQNANLSKKHVFDLVEGLSHFFSIPQRKTAIVKYYSLETHSRHNQTSLNSSVHNEMILSYDLDAQIDFSSNKKEVIEKHHHSPTYRIPRHTIIQKNPLTQSMFDEEGQEQKLPLIRKSFSPARKTYIQTRSSNASPEVTTKTEETELQLPTEPEWKDEWMVDEVNGGFIMKRNPNTKEKQVMKKIIQTVAKRSLLGKDIESMSFPVDILAAESRLERLMNNLASAPNLLSNISHLPMLQKFIRTVVFGLQVSFLSLRNQKPFDPLLGQTYQCKFSHHCEGYAEQIAVSPGISAIYLISNDFSVSAVLKQTLKLTMNSASWENEGTYKVKFGEEEEICFTTPPVVLNGMTYSKREFLLEQRSFYWIKNQNIILILNFEPKHAFSCNDDAKKDYFQGTIYEVTPQFMNIFLLKKQNPAQRHIVRVIDKVKGRWTKYLHCQGHTIPFSQISISQMLNNSHPLPSDSCFRADINKLRTCDLQLAQSIKDSLEEAQRRDESLRSQTREN